MALTILKLFFVPGYFGSRYEQTMLDSSMARSHMYFKSILFSDFDLYQSLNGKEQKQQKCIYKNTLSQNIDLVNCYLTFTQNITYICVQTFLSKNDEVEFMCVLSTIIFVIYFGLSSDL